MTERLITNLLDETHLRDIFAILHTKIVKKKNEPLVEGWVLPGPTQGPHAVPRELDAGDSYLGQAVFPAVLEIRCPT